MRLVRNLSFFVPRPSSSAYALLRAANFQRQPGNGSNPGTRSMEHGASIRCWGLGIRSWSAAVRFPLCSLDPVRCSPLPPPCSPSPRWKSLRLSPPSDYLRKPRHSLRYRLANRCGFSLSFSSLRSLYSFFPSALVACECWLMLRQTSFALEVKINLKIDIKKKRTLVC